jgi:hypothetical protein
MSTEDYQMANLSKTSVYNPEGYMDDAFATGRIQQDMVKDF